MCQYSDIYLNKSNLLNDSFLCTELKKILVSEFFFKFNNYFFSTGTPTTNKLDDGIPVTHLYDFKYRYSKWYPQTTNKIMLRNTGGTIQY